MSEQCTLGFIGSGNMAEAIARGFLARHMLTAERMSASDVSPVRRALFSGLGITAMDANRAVLERSDIIILAVKPQVIAAVLEDLRGSFQPRHLVISIAAGIATATIEVFTGSLPVIRVMPNTPILVGRGASALCRGRYAGADHAATARRLFETGGIAVEVNEAAMDAVTALSGSGPAYFFYMAEHLLAAAAAAGLPREVAEPLLFETAAGAAEMLKRSGASPARLREMVTSPGGTTEAALRYFDAHNMSGALAGGFRAAADRAAQLQKKDA